MSVRVVHGGELVISDACKSCDAFFFVNCF